jgi:O-antigen/teichoic acid export membrane protein
LGADKLIPFLVGGLLIYTTHVFLCAGLLIQKKTGTMALALICSTALNVVLNCVLLPKFGLQGAAVALLLTHIVTILLLWLASSRILPIGIRVTALAKYAAAGAAGWAVASQIHLPSHLLNAASRCAVGITIYGAALCLLDSRARALPAYLLRSWRSEAALPTAIVEEPIISEIAAEEEEVCK